MRIVVVEDHSMMREAVRHVCAPNSGFEVVGEAVAAEAALPLIAKLRPELVILDVGLPDRDGFTVAEYIRRTLPAVRILMLTGQLDDWTIYRAEKLRVHGFLDKTTNTTATLRVALQALAMGKTYFSPAYEGARVARRTNSHSFEKVLSNTEQTVLSLVGEGLSDEEVAGRLGISATTAQTHRSHILQKLQIKGTPKLVAYAVANGFTRVPSHSPFLRTGS